MRPSKLAKGAWAYRSYALKSDFKVEGWLR